MKIFITDGSSVGWQRIVKLLVNIQQLQFLGGASDASTTLDSLRSLKPDLLILDIELPERRGIEFLKKITQEQPGLKVIVLTNASSSHYKRKCTEAGALLFFDKSTQFQDVPLAVSGLMREQHNIQLNTPSQL